MKMRSFFVLLLIAFAGVFFLRSIENSRINQAETSKQNQLSQAPDNFGRDFFDLFLETDDDREEDDDDKNKKGNLSNHVLGHAIENQFRFIYFPDLFDPQFLHPKARSNQFLKFIILYRVFRI